MIVRRATEEDIPRIVEMAERFYAVSGYERIAPMTKESVAGLAIITMGSGVMLVAEHAGAVVAMACLHVDHFLFNIGVKVAHELVYWIEPEHRGGMLAARMLKAIEQGAREVGASWVRMATLASSPPQASALYERMGYTPSESYFCKQVT